MKKWIQRILGQQKKERSLAAPMDLDLVKSMLQDILSTRADEIDCEECFRQLDYFVEYHLSDESAAQKLPLVEDHLKRCKDCKEEFNLLLLALEKIT